MRRRSSWGLRPQTPRIYRFLARMVGNSSKVRLPPPSRLEVGATGTFIARREDALFLGPPGTGKGHFAQAIGQAVIQQGYRAFYRETQALLEEIADAKVEYREERGIGGGWDEEPFREGF